MKCVICGQTIGSRETRAYVMVYRNGRPRKLYACGTCNGGRFGSQFDRLIDALPVDSDGRLLNVSRAELQALILATSREKLEKRLREARACLVKDLKQRFGRGRFDFANRRLVGDNKLVLQWQTRPAPEKTVAYLNQQTTTGYVNIIDLKG